MSNPDSTIEILSWNDVADVVERVNPSFVHLINQITPDNSYKIYRVKYPYGAEIVKEGNFYLPTQSNNSQAVLEDFSNHHDLPFGIIVNRSIECFIKSRDRVIPFFVGQPGMITSLWTNLDQGTSFQSLLPWNITAGARSAFLLPKITDMVSHARLEKNFNTRFPLPGALEEHWNIFSKISRVSHEEWNTEILFFSKKWMQSILHDDAWQSVKAFLLQTAWEDSKFWRNEMSLDFMLNAFLRHMEEKGIKIKAKMLAVLKRLIEISLGVFPGFVPATDESLIPLNCLQDSYVQLYKLGKYIPTIMVPHAITASDNNLPVYYSLCWDMLLEPFSEEKTHHNTMTVLEEVDKLLRLMKEYFEQNQQFFSEDSPITLLKNTAFNCFHSSQSHVKSIFSSKTVMDSDKRFFVCLNKAQDSVSCYASQFMRGCVQVVRDGSL